MATHNPEYVSIALPAGGSDDGFPDFSYVAVKDGVAIGNIYKINEISGDRPIVTIPDYKTFVLMLSSNAEIIEHSPVPAGTEWDGEKFILPDEDDGFEVIGSI